MQNAGKYMRAIQIKRFSEIDLSDQFFDSLKADYVGFEGWFGRKAASEDLAYILDDEDGALHAFLYLKIEDGADTEVVPSLPSARRLKLGTFKVDPHGTRLGERFLKIAIDQALKDDLEEIYVTAFEKHDKLIALFELFGFNHHGVKTTESGTEQVFIKKLFETGREIVNGYPVINMGDNRVYVVGIKPGYHTKLFPDSKLNTENANDYISDVSHTNGIFKNYIGAAPGLRNLHKGDIIVIYRTKDDNAANAYYSSVLTSFCTVTDIKYPAEFSDFDEFYRYCKPYSVLSREELREYYANKRSTVVTMVYNVAFKHRLTNRFIQEHIGKPEYWGFFELQYSHLRTLIVASGINARLFNWRG